MRNCRNPKSALRNSIAAAALLLAAGPALAQVQGEAQPQLPGVTPPPAAEAAPMAAPQAAPGAMVLDPAKIEADHRRTMGEVDAKLSGLKVAPGSLPNADISGHKGDLDALAALQREILFIQLQQKRADLATKLWATVNGAEETARADAPTAGTPTDTQPQPGKGKQSEPQTVVSVPLPDPMPVVSSILGTGDDVRATILVPFSGEVSAKKGTMLPNGMRVQSLSADGVVVTDRHGARRTLSFGDQVPRFQPGAPGAVFPNGAGLN